MEFNLHIFALDGKPVIPKPSTHLINPSALWQTHWVRRGQGIGADEKCAEKPVLVGHLKCSGALGFLHSEVSVSSKPRCAIFFPRCKFAPLGMGVGKATTVLHGNHMQCKPQERQLWWNPVRGCPAYMTAHIQDQNWRLQLYPCGFHVWVWQAKLHDFNILYSLW